MVKRIALIRQSDKLVVNVCLWDTANYWDSPSGTLDRECPEYVYPGYSYIDGEWIAPAKPPEPPEE